MNQGIGEQMLMKSAMGGLGNTPQAAPAQPVGAGKPSSSAIQILTNYFQNRGIPLQQGMVAVQQELNEGLKLMQFKNSLLAIKNLDHGTAQIHFFTLDTEAQLSEDIKHFIDLMRKAGIHKVYSSDADPVFTQAIQEFGGQSQQSDNPKFKLMATL